MTGTDVTSLVPGRYDAVVDGYGYIFDRTQDQRARYTSTPTFVERQNVGGSYGDNEQDFFLTLSQNDWSGGQGQLFFRAADPDSRRQYYWSAYIDTSVPGQVFPRLRASSVTVANNVKSGCPRGKSGFGEHAYATATNLYTMNAAGTISDKGAHGAGSCNQWGVVADGQNVYVAGSTTIRRWDGAAFNNFGAANANAGALAFLNNTLFSCDGSVLKQYDTAGAATTLFTWRGAAGTALTALDQNPKLAAFGGSLLIWWPQLNDSPELWVYDGTGTKILAKFDRSMIGYDIYVQNGVVYLSGGITEVDATDPTDARMRTVIMYYANGSFGELWRAVRRTQTVTLALNHGSLPALGSLHGKLIWSDVQDGSLISYNPGTGSVDSLCQIQSSGTGPGFISGTSTSLFAACDGTTKPVTLYPAATPAATAYVTSSIFDFDSSLTKNFSGIKVDFVKTGSDPTLDIYYTLDDNSTGGAGNLVRTAAVSGTEYSLSGVSGRGLTVTLKMNYTSSGVIKVKRVYVRASPTLQAYKYREYVLSLTGKDGRGHVRLNDSGDMPRDGLEQATNLLASMASTTPISITDRFGTFTGIIEPGKTELVEIRPDEYIAHVTVREV